MAAICASTGSTDTSLWTHYNAGEREYCGNRFPDGLRKNDRYAIDARPAKQKRQMALTSALLCPVQTYISLCEPASGFRLKEQLWTRMCTCKIVYIWQLDQISIHGLSEQSLMPGGLEKNIVMPTIKVVSHETHIGLYGMVARGLVSQGFRSCYVGPLSGSSPGCQ